MKQVLFAAAIFSASLGSAFATPASEAQTHFAAIGSGDMAVLMRTYADNAQLNWIGGPLDGGYAGADSIRGTWEKFMKAAGALKVSIGSLEESANPKGATVVANVLFEGKSTIKVRYVLTYRDNKLVNETWQIDPKLAVAAY
ncbi:nuclear transport factor 2 family protein [Undibacterium sp. TJN25]|uniref:nuclear transport factor 2 family protein n=1 Tax=Undibacterium sp. TJN25 TaxID=3413056 RepID=UPI003BEF8F3C